MVTLGICYGRHLKKYVGANDESYVVFALNVARKITVSRYDNMIKNALQIDDMSEMAKLATVIDEGISNESELQAYLIEHSKSPYELAKMWLALKSDSENYVDVNSILNSWLSAFPQKNFERWGDRNCLTDVSRAWFKRDGVPLDVQVQEINNMCEIGREITIEDCIEFVKTFKPNSYKNPIALIRETINEKFKSITGFGLKEYYANHLIIDNTLDVNFEQTEDIPF